MSKSPIGWMSLFGNPATEIPVTPAKSPEELRLEAIKRFISKHEKTPAAEKVCAYLSEIHGIPVPNGFAKRMKASHTAASMSLETQDETNDYFTFETTSSAPTNKDKKTRATLHFPLENVDTIIRACNVWKPFLNEDDWLKLVRQEVLSMCRIHVSVIRVDTLRADGFKFTRDPEHITMRTIVTKDGEFKYDTVT